MFINEKYWRGVISGDQCSGIACVLRAALRGASYLYGIGARLIVFLHEKHLLPCESVDAAVISIGNITAGGTGKTPVVAWSVSQLIEAGANVAVVTRGYRSVDGQSDEAVMLGEATGARIYVDADRVAAARRAVDGGAGGAGGAGGEAGGGAGGEAGGAGGAGVIVMDDGFQHRRLHRDLNVALIDAINPFGYGYMLPRGLLREPPRVLSQAHIIIMTRCDLVPEEQVRAVRRRLEGLSDATILMSSMKPVALRMADGQKKEPGFLRGKSVVAFCGIGNPDGFFAMLEAQGAIVLESRIFNDHHDYTDDELSQLSKLVRQSGADLLVTTAKDAVKTDKLAHESEACVLEIDLEFQAPGRRQFLEKLVDTCKRKGKLR